MAIPSKERDMQVQRVMTTDVVSVRSDATYKEVAERLVAAAVNGLPVVDEQGRVAGIVTEADLVARTAYDGPRHRALAVLVDALSAREHPWVTKAAGWTAADVMTRTVVTCHADEDVHAVARRMLEHGVKCLPVVDDGMLVGVVSRRDLLRALVRPDAEIAAEITQVLRADPNRPDDHHVQATVVDGRVTLTGDVRYAWDAPVIVAMVRGVDGVIGVESHLHHREPVPPTTPPPWPWVTPVR